MHTGVAPPHAPQSAPSLPHASALDALQCPSLVQQPAHVLRSHKHAPFLHTSPTPQVSAHATVVMLTLQKPSAHSSPVSHSLVSRQSFAQ